MAQLLVKAVDGENAMRYAAGDIVTIVDDDWTWGREESLDQWVSEGLDPAQWPGMFQIIQVPGVDVADLSQYVAQGQGIRRLFSLDLTQFPVVQPVSAAQGTRKVGQVSAPVAPATSMVATDQPTLIGAITAKAGFAPYVPPTIASAPVSNK